MFARRRKREREEVKEVEGVEREAGSIRANLKKE